MSTVMMMRPIGPLVTADAALLELTGQQYCYNTAEAARGARRRMRRLLIVVVAVFSLSIDDASWLASFFSLSAALYYS